MLLPVMTSFLTLIHFPNLPDSNTILLQHHLTAVLDSTTLLRSQLFVNSSLSLILYIINLLIFTCQEWKVSHLHLNWKQAEIST